MISKCPQCSAEVKISSHPQIGTQVHCKRCGRSLEIVWLYPVLLDVAETEVPRREKNIAASTATPVDP